jgi:hypothetical protein
LQKVEFSEGAYEVKATGAWENSYTLTYGASKIRLSEHEKNLVAQGDFDALAHLQPDLYFVSLAINGAQPRPDFFEFDGLLSASRLEMYARWCAAKDIANMECPRSMRETVCFMPGSTESPQCAFFFFLRNKCYVEVINAKS